MPYLQLRDARYPLAAGENRICRNTETDIQLSDDKSNDDLAVAVIILAPDGTVTVRRSHKDGLLLLNRVQTGAGPSPLLHGDRLTVGSSELLFADEAQLGDTAEHIAAADTPVAVTSGAVPASRSRGRLVSLVDGREYSVPAAGLSIGRDVACDVVLASGTVSRSHATIQATAQGYTLVDTSANGVFVNGARIARELPLGRGDTVRIGTEEFRFYAAPESAEAPLELSAVPALQKTAAIRNFRRPTPANDASITAPTATKPVLATLEVSNEGPTKGTRHTISSPLAHIGRAPYNDVVIVDGSVSETHAKLQRREDSWYLMDLDSTNGTYAGGGRLSSEFRLTAGADVRFGGVKMIFEPAVEARTLSGSTRVIAGFKAPEPKRLGQDASWSAPIGEKREPAGLSRSLLLVVAAALGFATYLLVRGGSR